MVAVMVGLRTDPAEIRLGDTGTTVAAKNVGFAKPTLGTAQ
jgi:hypothetical protein